MKNLLVPTDFSACAAHATKVAIDLAGYYDAKVHMFSCLQIPTDWHEWSPEKQTEAAIYKREVRNTKLLFQEWEDKAKAKNISFSSSYMGGNLLKNTEKLIAELSIDAVVMGSYGASGKNELFIGSNTQKVVRAVHCPVFIIKENISPVQFKNVMYASDFNLNELSVFKRFLQIIRPFDPMIHLVQINTYSWFYQPYAVVKEILKDFADLCPPGKSKQYFYKDYSVDAGIRHFSDELDVDLIAISNYNRRPLKRILQGSNVEALVNHSDRPVLSLDFPD